jgi:hypothetical protein
MAGYSSTYSGDLTTTVASFLYNTVQNARGDAKQEKITAEKEAKKYGVDPQLKRGEFFKQALPYRFTPSMFREKKFGDKFKYPDYFARGQKTELASPLPSDYFNRGQSSPITAQAKERRAGNPFPFVAVGAPLNQQVQANTPMVDSTTKYTDTVNKDKPVKVKDEMLGVLFAKVAESMGRTVASLADKQGQIDGEIASAKESSLGIAKALELNTDIVSDKLDQLIDVMNQQIDFNKQQADLKETEDVKEKVADTDITSGTDRFAKVGESVGEVLAENDREDDLVDRMNTDPNIPKAEAGGMFSGPNSGYPVMLHGNEMVTPVNNNYTQSFEMGTPTQGIQQYEVGTSQASTAPSVTPNESIMSGSPLRSPTLNQNETNDATTEDLASAMAMPSQVAGLLAMDKTANAAGMLADQSPGMQSVVSSVTDPIADAFNIKNSVKQKFTTNVLPSKKAFARSSGGMFGQSGDSEGFFETMGGLIGGGVKNVKNFFKFLGNAFNDRGNGPPGIGYGRRVGGSTKNISNNTFKGSKVGTGGFALPGTGTVLKPLTTRNSAGGYETRLETQFHLLGIPLGLRERYRGDTGKSKMGSLWPLENPDSRSGVERFNQNRDRPYNLVPYYGGSDMVRPEAIPQRNLRTAPQSTPTRTNRYGETESSNPITNMVRGIRDMYIPESRIRAIEEAQGKPLGNTTYGEFQRGLIDQYGSSNYGEQRRQILGPQSSLPTPPSNNMANILNMNSMDAKMKGASRLAPVVINMSDAVAMGGTEQPQEVSAFATVADPGTSAYTDAYKPSFLG